MFNLIGKQERETRSIDLIELSQLLGGSLNFEDGQLLGQSLLSQKKVSLRDRENKLTFWGVSTLALVLGSVAALTSAFQANKGSELYIAGALVMGLSAIATTTQFLKYFTRSIPGVTEKDILASPNQSRLRKSIEILKELRRRECEIFLQAGLGKLYKVRAKVLSDPKFTLLLIGDENLRTHLAWDKRLVHGTLCVRKADVVDLISKSREGEGEFSKFSPYLIAFCRDKKLQEHYFKNADNWHNPHRPDYKMKLKKPWGVLYDRLLKEIYLNADKFNQWIENPDENVPDQAFENTIAKLLGLKNKPVSGRKVLEFRKLQHSSLDSFLKKREFIDESLLPKFEDINRKKNKKT